MTIANPLILTPSQRDVLRAALGGRILALCFGAGVDSTAVMVAMHSAGLRPDVITFADTGGESPGTYQHLDRMQKVMARWGWPAIDVCRAKPLPQTGYTDLYGNCWKNETLPSLAFGMSSCSVKFKGVPQDQFLMGVSRGPNRRPAHPVWLHAQATGQRIVKLIGYDCGAADLRRARKAAAAAAASAFDFAHPLQLLGWHRADCIEAITAHLGADHVPQKSSCWFCPAMKQWELFWQAAHHPEQLEAALQLERRALTGKHSRFDEVEFGSTWEDMVRNAPSFPSTKTCVGLGRSFAWNHWARLNGVVDDDFMVVRGQKQRFIRLAIEHQTDGNALDQRTAQRIAEGAAA